MDRIKSRRFRRLLLATVIPTVVIATSMPQSADADLVGHGGMIRSIDVSPETGQVLTASFDFSAKLWQFDEQRELLSLDYHDGPVNAVRFLPGGKRAVSAGSDGKTVVWSLTDGKVEADYVDHRGRVMALAVSPSGEFVMSGGWDGRLAIRRTDGAGDPIYIETGVPIIAAAFLDDGKRVIGGGRDGRLVIHRIADGIKTAEIAAHDLGLTALAPTPKGDRIVTIGLDNATRVWRARDMRLIAEFKADPVVKPVAISVDASGETAAVTYIDGLLIHLKLATAEVLNGFKVDDKPIFAVELSADGNFALTAGLDDRAKVWHLASGDRIDVGGIDDESIPKPWLESNEPGAVLYRKCANCHALTANERQRAGPHFQGLFGRPAGAVEDYRYSKALLDTDIVWTEETVAELFRVGPDYFMPGTKMPVQQVRDDALLQDLVGYMKSIVPMN